MRIKFVLNLSEMHNDNLSQETDYYFKSWLMKEIIKIIFWYQIELINQSFILSDEKLKKINIYFDYPVDYSFTYEISRYINIQIL